MRSSRETLPSGANARSLMPSILPLLLLVAALAFLWASDRALGPPRRRGALAKAAYALAIEPALGLSCTGCTVAWAWSRAMLLGDLAATILTREGHGAL